MSPLGIEAAWQKHSRAMWGFACHLTHNPDTADEIAADAWVRAIQAWPRLAPNATPGPWLHRIVKNLAVDGWRRGQRIAWTRIADEDREGDWIDEADYLGAVLTQPLGYSHVEVEAEHRDRLDRVRVAVAAIPTQPQRQALLLDWAGFGTAETATVLHLSSVWAVKSLRFRARESFAAAYAAAGGY